MYRVVQSLSKFQPVFRCLAKNRRESEYFNTFLRTISIQHSALLQVNDGRGNRYNGPPGINSGSNFGSGTNIDRSCQRLDMDIKRMGRINRSEIEEILQDIRDMKKATSSQSLMIIRCCGDLLPEDLPETRTKLVNEIWKTMENLKVPMDISHYNALLKVYLENEHKFSPTEFLKTLDVKGVEPNRVTYQRLIATFCQYGDIDGASTILQHMKEKQLPINEHVFNALILGHAQSNDMESAEGIISVMKQAGLEPNDDTFVTLMCGYAKKGDITNIKRIVQECETRETYLVDRDFLDVIYTLAKNGHAELIDEIIPFIKVHAGFNQDATILIIKLVNIGQEDIAFKILKMMPRNSRQGQGEQEQQPSGYFFIKQMVKSDTTPSEKVIKICNDMREEGLNHLALVKACEHALILNNFEKAFDFLEALHEEGFRMRQHFFWPFFAAAKTEQEVYYGIKCMLFLGIPPNLETLREYTLPALFNATKGKESIENTLEKLSGHSKIPITNIVPAAMSHFFLNNQLDIAARFAGKFRQRLLTQNNLRRQLVDAYLRTKDTPNFVRIIGSSAFEGDDALRHTVEALLYDLAAACKPMGKKAVLLPVLNMLLSYGFGITNSGAEILQNNLGEELTPELSNVILQLTSSDLTPKLDFTREMREKYNSQSQASESIGLNAEELEALLQRNIEAGLPTRSLMRQMFMLYCREKNLEKVEHFKEQLLSEGFVFTTGSLVMLMDLYAHFEKVQEAKDVYSEIKKREMSNDFGMDDIKILNYASMLISHGSYEDAKEVLSTQSRRDQTILETRVRGGAGVNATVWKILNHLAEAGDVDKVKEIFNLVKERGFTTPNNVVLGPLIKVHLVNENLKGALEEYENCAKEYHVTPWKGELFCQFIKNDDPESLQKVLDISTNLHGEVNSLYDLVFAFIECGKIRQAKKLLETPGLRPRNDKLEFTCQKFLDANKVEELEKLVAVTKDLFDIDRNSLYFYLLKAYCKNNDPDKALSIWTSLQEENIQPSADLLIYLADFLRKNDRVIPFIIPEESTSVSQEFLVQGTSTSFSTKEPTSLRDREMSNFRKQLENNEIDTALQLKQRLESGGTRLSLENETALIEKMLQAERLGEAFKLTDDMIQRGAYPYPKVLRFLVSKLSGAGDVGALSRLNDCLPHDLKKNMSFAHRVCNAYNNAGRGKEYFENYMQNNFDTVIDDPVYAISAYTYLLNKNQDLAPAFEELAEKIAKGGNPALYNALWMHHLTIKNFEKSREIWNSHLSQSHKAVFRSIVIQSRAEKDEEISQEFVNQVCSSQFMSNENKAIAVSTHVDVLCLNDKIPEAVNFLKTHLKTLAVSDFNLGILRLIKEKVELKGHQFPCHIPEKTTSVSQQTRKAVNS